MRLARRWTRSLVRTVADFSRLFPKIEQIAPSDTLLYPVAHWRETVCGKMVTQWDDITLEWDLITRWDHQTQAMVESELSFRILKTMKANWDDALMAICSQLYLDLRTAGIFHLHPPIFYYHDPVSSVAIADIGKAD